MATVTSFNEALNLQNVYIDLLNKSISNYKKTALVKRTKEYITERINQFRELWSKIEKNHVQVELYFANLEEKPTCEYFVNNTYLHIEDKYFEFMGVIKGALSKFEEQSPPLSPTLHESTRLNPSMATQLLRLPKISLPTFSGSYESWRSFHDLFNSLVHQNPSLSDAQKLHYLKSVVSGEAEHLLRQFQITDANYERAWTVLLNRYNNNRVLVNAQLKILFNLKQVSSESVNSIKSLMDTSNECLCELESLGVSTSNWDPLLVYLIMQKLPNETHRMWELELDGASALPSFDRLKLFLEKRFRMLEAVAEHKTNLQPRSHTGSKSRFLTHLASPANNNCVCCKELHKLKVCPKFSTLPLQQRYNIAKINKLCTNCLANSHPTHLCSSKYTCQKCHRRHHTLLHNSAQGSVPFKVQQANIQTSSSLASEPNPSNNTRDLEPAVFLSTQSTHSFCCTKQTKPLSKALLSTALVNVPTRTGIITLRALIDSGSQVSFITKTAARQLNLKHFPTSITITGVGRTKTTHANTQIEFSLLPMNQSTQVQVSVTALVVPSITNILPPSTVSRDHWTHLNNLNLADPNYYMPGKIDLLLGAEVYSTIVLDGLIKGPVGSPTAQNSILGWLLFGQVNSKGEEATIQSFSTQVHSTTNDCDLNSTLRTFWEVEELPIQVRQSSAEEECEKYYKNSVRRLPSGAYEVKIPFIKNQAPDLGTSWALAQKRLTLLEKRLSQNSILSSEYTKNLQEYIELGHMKPVSHCSASPSYYMPHHAVVKESTTSKVRVVFDASAKTSNGKSLNEHMHSGPVIQSDLYSLLLRWRKFKYAMSADIEKMYRMIHLNHSDQPYHRILWRPTTLEPIQEYQMTRVTFGTTSAPYLAIKTLHQLAHDEQKRFPKAAQVLTQDFYVDDAITGTDSLAEAISLQQELTQLLLSGGFNLRKWSSNDAEILATIPEEKREAKPTLTFARDEMVKTLGLIWHPATDHFTLQHPEVKLGPCTKRQILSGVAQLFDPLGWISPYVIKAKILMQGLWLLGSSWDEPLTASIQREWREFQLQFPQISTLKIPRWLKTYSTSTIQLHGFSDASQRAYSAVVYVRVIDEQGRLTVNLLTAKSKVAPVKLMTLPRLELSGAYLLVKLLHKVRKELNFSSITTFAWTDSTIVLNWVQYPPHKLKTFVANRVSQIQELLPSITWRFVRSKDNPADCNSRGMNVHELRTSLLWWHGPKWLQEEETSWPRHPNMSVTHLPEVRKDCVPSSFCSYISQDTISSFSSYTKLLRVFAYVLRFLNKLRRSCPHTQQQLAATELQVARIQLIRSIQKEAFSREYQALERGQLIPSKSPLLPLNPGLNEHHLITVGGRLAHSNVPTSQKHQIILPSKHHFTKLLIEYTHKLTLHGGSELVLNTLRTEYWIIRGRQNIKQVLHKCIHCFKISAKSRPQLMGNLPPARVTVSAPFSKVGIDFAGPFHLKMSNYRGVRTYKGYVCIFVCMATKAIHLETVSDMSTAAFLAALKRFIGRRGLCSDIYSDCGSNFIGAHKELKLQLTQCLKEAENFSITQNIKWHFNPPSAPHFGGLWEAGVKSVKYHLKRVLQDSNLTYEEFSTTLIQIEACLNSRPLRPLSDDPNDLQALTPGHFLIGRPLLAPPEATEEKFTSLDRWKYVQALQRHFWTRWSKEYLNHLQNRPKWLVKTEELKIDDLVVVKDNQLTPRAWLLGRVMQVHPGSDGIVRVLTIKTQNNIIKRPIHKICKLPIEH